MWCFQILFRSLDSQEATTVDIGEEEELTPRTERRPVTAMRASSIHRLARSSRSNLGKVTADIL